MAVYSMFIKLLAHGNYSTVIDTNCGDVLLDVKVGDGSDPNVIAIIVGVGMQSTDNAFVHEQFVPGVAGSISGNSSKDKNYDDIGAGDDYEDVYSFSRTNSERMRSTPRLPTAWKTICYMTCYKLPVHSYQ